MKALIFGYGGTSRELAFWLPEAGFSSIQYLDDNVCNPAVVGNFSDWEKMTDHHFFSGIGSPKTMLRRGQILSSLPMACFTSVAAKNTFLYSKKWGHGCQIFPMSTIGTDVLLHNHILIYHGCVIAHDTTIHDNTIVSNGAVISGHVTIQKGCYVGANATVLENIEIGSNTIIAAGATVTKDVPANSIYISTNKILPNQTITTD